VSKPVVLIAEQLSPATVDALGPDFDVRHVDGTDRAALLAALPEAHAILIRSATQVDAEAIAAGSALKVVARAGVGLDNVDVKAATEAGVMVVNAPTSNVVSAAELAVGHILALARHIPEANASMKAGEWKRSAFTGFELYEKTIGIVGLGRIGTLVAQRLAGFEVEHTALEAAGWRVVDWYEGAGELALLKGGYGKGTAKGSQMHRDRLWLSPACLGGEGSQVSLF